MAAFNYPGPYKDLSASDVTEILQAGGTRINFEDLATALEEYLGSAITIVTALNSTSDTSVLAASQGKILKDQITAIQNVLLSDNATLDSFQEVVDFIEANKENLDNLAISNIAGLQNALNAINAAVTAVNAAITTHVSRTNNPHSVTKAQVGLSNADNTSDLDKPLSTAMILALSRKLTNWNTVTAFQAKDYCHLDGHIFEAITANTTRNPHTEWDSVNNGPYWRSCTIENGRYFDLYDADGDSFSRFPGTLAQLIAQYPLTPARDWTFQTTTAGTFTANGQAISVLVGDVLRYDQPSGKFVNTKNDAPQYLTVPANGHVQCDNTNVNHYNWNSPSNLSDFIPQNLTPGAITIIRLNVNTNDTPDLIKVNTSLTGRISSAWLDNTDMELTIHALTSTTYEWWYLPKSRTNG